MAELDSDFFARPTLVVARDLLGKALCRREGATTLKFIITEVEAYDGFDDRASHAFGQLVPKRSKVMFGKPGHWYIYLCYGIHLMLNIVTREEGYPAAILIRGVVGISGPGRVGKSLNISRELNEKISATRTGLWIEDNEIKVRKSDIKTTPRIGIDYAGPIWSKKHWRFVWLDPELKKKNARQVR